MFHGASTLIAELSNWDVSRVTRMTSMCYGAVSFSADLNNGAFKKS